MVKTHIFSIEEVLLDIKDYLLPYTDYAPIKMHVIIRDMLDEVCFIQGHSTEGYSMEIGERCAREELLGYDIPPSICEEVIAIIKKSLIGTLLDAVSNSTSYRLSYIQLNEYEYCISAFFYTGKRFQIRPQETCYATTIPYHWAQSVD